MSDLDLPTHVAQRVRAAAEALMAKAPEMTGQSPMLAVAALLLAAGSAAALAKIPYKEMIALISRYYESVLLVEAESELDEGAVALPLRNPDEPN